MKNILFITLLIIGLASCKKEPQLVPDEPETIPVKNDTTVIINPDTTKTSDTIGKTKIYFLLNISLAITDVIDYKQDTSNVRVFVNNKLFTKLHGQYNGQDLIGYANFIYWPGQTNNTEAIWMKKGDSLVIEFDHLEYSTDNPGFNVPHNNTLKVYKNAPLVANQVNNAGNEVIYDNGLIVTMVNTDKYLGIGKEDGGRTYTWYLGRKYRKVFILK